MTCFNSLISWFFITYVWRATNNSIVLSWGLLANQSKVFKSVLRRGNVLYITTFHRDIVKFLSAKCLKWEKIIGHSLLPMIGMYFSVSMHAHIIKFNIHVCKNCGQLWLDMYSNSFYTLTQKYSIHWRWSVFQCSSTVSVVLNIDDTTWNTIQSIKKSINQLIIQSFNQSIFNSF